MGMLLDVSELAIFLARWRWSAEEDARTVKSGDWVAAHLVFSVLVIHSPSMSVLFSLLLIISLALFYDALSSFLSLPLLCNALLLSFSYSSL